MQVKYIAQIPSSPPLTSSQSNILIPLDMLVISGFGVVLAGAVGIVKLFFDREFKAMERTLSQDQVAKEKMNDEILALKNDLQNFKLESSKEFVTREEFVRAITVSDGKLNAVYREIQQVNSQIRLVFAKWGMTNEQ